LSKQKDKGRRGEHKTDSFFNKIYGKIVCRRVPCSGAIPGLPGDNILDLTRQGYGRPFQIETKNKKNPSGWTTLDKLPGIHNDMLVLWKTNERDCIVVMRGSFYQELVGPMVEKE